MLKCFTAFGYQPVIPPLMEYEASLLADAGAATARQAFRLMDPASREMLALRADMTTQLARIAETSLSSAPRPLRLSYAGYTLRTAPEPLQTRRQHTQIGIELFGTGAPAHDAEVIAVPVEALRDLQLTDLTLDISVPTLLDTLLQQQPVADREAIKAAIARKDTAALRTLKQEFIAEITEAAGAAPRALEKLRSLAKSSPALTRALHEVEQMLEALKRLGATLPITIDLLEMRGFGYYSGLAFSLFLRNPAREIGRGGHYRTTGGEEAVGFTFYIDDILEALGDPTPRKRIAVDAATPLNLLRPLHEQGYETVLIDSSPPTMDMESEARRLGCTHRLRGTDIIELL
jgi:ATP phosphoribosyltransferase regulatory subunit